ncbi:phosphoglycerate dehydrogenase-like oxidoreductase [Halobacteroides halobius DSM 5150]|uniref:Phosphoglycerate dehydrogenase-like oxidoreductase n=1 Tax=Halobacteroides halobius (strain ATCC 35273 / DSM 5150 / MD-1) TaxID=748449 RepID=L0K6G5_HALHC|nr:D-2-hydroxyacid dehydrogenase [Halobacteroides halobius]AGB40837.1 phosphoglycerate dehydrogenase-like oxidoreductase [Halobacteroides halobius DSM 5150]
MTKSLEILIMFDSNFTAEQLNKLQEIIPNGIVNNVAYDNVSVEMLNRADIIFGWPTEEELQEAKNLQWLHLPSAGVDEYANQDLYHSSDIIVTNSSGVYGLPIAEHVFSLILAFNRNLPHYLKQKQKKEWHRKETRKDLWESTIGILGLGDLGSKVAKRAKAWEMKVVAVNRTIKEAPDYIDCLYDPTGIDQLLAQSDYIVLALPQTEETKGIISTAELKQMKEDAFLVNVGRGSLIDQPALIKALKKEWIAGAGLDVTTPEPLPKDNPLWELSNVILTPHYSGNSPTNYQRLFNIFSKNLRHYITEESLENVVDFKAGY